MHIISIHLYGSFFLIDSKEEPNEAAEIDAHAYVIISFMRLSACLYVCMCTQETVRETACLCLYMRACVRACVLFDPASADQVLPGFVPLPYIVHSQY